jgi:hypothetical protein
MMHRPCRAGGVTIRALPRCVVLEGSVWTIVPLELPRASWSYPGPAGVTQGQLELRTCDESAYQRFVFNRTGVPQFNSTGVPQLNSAGVPQFNSAGVPQLNNAGVPQGMLSQAGNRRDGSHGTGAQQGVDNAAPKGVANARGVLTSCDIPVGNSSRRLPGGCSAGVGKTGPCCVKPNGWWGWNMELAGCTPGDMNQVSMLSTR